jgi:hypothetical protein
VENPGTWGNGLRIEIDYDTVVLPNASIDPDNLLTQNELFNLIISEVAVQNGLMVVVQSETYRNLTLRAGARTNALEVVNAGSRLVQLDRQGLLPLDQNIPDPPFRPDGTGTLGSAQAGPLPANGSTFSITVDPDGTGTSPVTISNVALNYPTLPDAIDTFAELRPFLEAAIRSAANDPAATPAVQPLLAGAAVQLVNGAYRVLLGRAGANFFAAATVSFGGPAAGGLGLAGAIVGPQMFEPTTPGADSGALTSVALLGTQLAKTGVFALDDVSLFNILCIPAAADLAANDMRAVYAGAETYCANKRAFLIVDVPVAADDPDAMQTWLVDNASLRHRNAAVYFPRLRIPDSLNQNRLRSVGPSGTLAGLYSATDAARGVWKAPAGTDVRLRNVPALDYLLTDRENGVLNPLGVNCLRNLPIHGNVSWGARTLDGADQQASEWKYVPVRRLALFLEESLYRGTTWVVFEPNDEPLWAQIRLNVGAFMHSLFRQGAFQGQTPREAYFVKCDKETTTQTDINLGIVNILVGFAPLKPAEFVIIKIQQIAGQIPT